MRVPRFHVTSLAGPELSLMPGNPTRPGGVAAGPGRPRPPFSTARAPRRSRGGRGGKPPFEEARRTPVRRALSVETIRAAACPAGTVSTGWSRNWPSWACPVSSAGDRARRRQPRSGKAGPFGQGGGRIVQAMRPIGRDGDRPRGDAGPDLETAGDHPVLCAPGEGATLLEAIAEANPPSRILYLIGPRGLAGAGGGNRCASPARSRCRSARRSCVDETAAIAFQSS